MDSEKDLALCYRVASYLMTLSMCACDKYCELREIPEERVEPAALDTPEAVFQCMGDLIAEGIDLRYLFNVGDVWGVYLRALCPPNFHDGINLMLQMGTPADLMYFFRACYRFGMSAMEDKTFDALEQLYYKYYPELEFLMNQTYDEDQYGSLVADAIRMSNVRGTRRAGSASRSTGAVRADPVYADLNSEKSTSIRPVVSPEEAYEFWKDAPMCRVHFSLKIDGVNTKTQFSDEKDKGLVLALSRGRSADSLDYTEAIRRVIAANEIHETALAGKITGESFVGLNNLAEIQRRYPDKDYKTPKSTAMAMLRAPENFVPDDYKYLSFRAFSVEGMNPADAFATLAAAGMDTPPSMIVEGETIPRDSLEHFNEWMNTNVLDYLYAQGQELGIGSDGVVMYLLADIHTERADKYSDSNIAIKYGHWAAAKYQSHVKRIVFDQRRVEASIVLEIEPVVMRDSNTATRVGVGSPDILISDGVKIGDMIEFERKSEAYNVYLRKVS